MKIVHCAEWYYPKQDGVASVVRKYAEYLAAYGHESWVITSLWDSGKEYEELNGVKILRLPIYGNDVKGIKGDGEKFIELLKRESFDVVVTYAAQTWHFDILKKIEKSSIGDPRLIGFPCGFSGLLGIRKLFYINYFKKLPKYLENFDMLILHSKNYIDYHFVKSNYSGRILVVSNGVDKDEFLGGKDIKRIEKILSENRVDLSKKLVLNVGNHMHAKNHKDFIRLAKYFKQYEFVQIGRDPAGILNCYKRCKRADKNIENYHSLQLVREDLISLYRICHIFVLTSTTEMFPLVILESMASKTPFIAYNVGNVKDLKGGLTVDTFQELREVLETLLEDDDRLRNLKEEGYLDVLENYGWDKSLYLYKCALESLVLKKVSESAQNKCCDAMLQ